MKQLLLLLLVFAIGLPVVNAQVPRARIHIEAVTPDGLISHGITTNSVSTGLRVVPHNTFVYLSPREISATVQTILTSTFTFVSRPAGSAAAFTAMTTPTTTNWVNFIADRTGEYQVRLVITTAGGTDDTTISIFASRYIGVGGFDGGATAFPQCMSCHAAHPNFVAIFDRWKVSDHALMARRGIRGEIPGYNQSCLKCHTTGSDMNLVAANDGFDDIQASVSWVFTSPSVAAWTSLSTSNALLQRANVGCEACHGPGSEHTAGGAIARTQVSVDDGVCAPCHSGGVNYPLYEEFINSDHFTPVWSNSFAQGTTSQNNSLGNCIRCHDGRGFANFAGYNRVTNTTGMNRIDQVDIGCSSCHDPHGNSNPYSIRNVPNLADTLGTGFNYAGMGGTGETCMSCHKSRRNNVTQLTVAMGSTWGPHSSVEADVLLGRNAAVWPGGAAYNSSSHIFAVENSCVTCHMGASPAVGNANRLRVGGHTFNMSNPATGYDHTASCAPCHGPKTSFDDFRAVADYDFNGTVEGVQAEVHGLLRHIRMALPPVGLDTIHFSLITTDHLERAYWNYLLILNDASFGMHNTKFSVAVLQETLRQLGGIIPVEFVSFTASLNKNVVTVNWETATETNNKGFEVERRIGDTWKTIGFVQGKGTTTEPSKYTYTDNVTNLGGKVAYRVKQLDFDGKFSYTKDIEIDLSSSVASYQLAQNYPNPFNPTTKIQFSLPYESKVKLTVYNIAGEVVAELVNGVRASGIHDVTFNMGSKVHSSGIYLYKIEASSLDGTQKFNQTKKMLLVK